MGEVGHLPLCGGGACGKGRGILTIRSGESSGDGKGFLFRCGGKKEAWVSIWSFRPLREGRRCRKKNTHYVDIWGDEQRFLWKKKRRRNLIRSCFWWRLCLRVFLRHDWNPQKTRGFICLDDKTGREKVQAKPHKQQLFLYHKGWGKRPESSLELYELEPANDDDGQKELLWHCSYFFPSFLSFLSLLALIKSAWFLDYQGAVQ